MAESRSLASWGGAQSRGHQGTVRGHDAFIILIVGLVSGYIHMPKLSKLYASNMGSWSCYLSAPNIICLFKKIIRILYIKSISFNVDFSDNLPFYFTLWMYCTKTLISMCLRPVHTNIHNLPLSGRSDILVFIFKNFVYI